VDAFQYGKTNRFFTPTSRADAMYVHLIHSSSKMGGTEARIGTVDIVLNNGFYQPGCEALVVNGTSNKCDLSFLWGEVELFFVQHVHMDVRRHTHWNLLQRIGRSCNKGSLSCRNTSASASLKCSAAFGGWNIGQITSWFLSLTKLTLIRT
jgi:hypothetical protein